MKITGVKITVIIIFLIVTHVHGQNSTVFTVHAN